MEETAPRELDNRVKLTLFVTGKGIKGGEYR